MTGHRRDAIKWLVLALVTVGASFLPTVGIRVFLYLCGGIAAAAGLVALGMLLELYGVMPLLLELYAGFLRFERSTADEARRLVRR